MLQSPYNHIILTHLYSSLFFWLEKGKNFLAPSKLYLTLGVRTHEYLLYENLYQNI